MAPGKIDTTSSETVRSADDYPTNTKSVDKPKLYLLEQFPPAAIKHAESLFDVIPPTTPRVHKWRQEADAILVRELVISREDIEDAPKLRAIGKQGTGIDIIDQDACAERNIPILNTPGVNAQSVAELVLTLTMAVAREVRSIAVRQASGEEVRKEHCCGTTMFGKPIGVVGMGAIGTAVARIFQGAFQSTVYACDPFAPTDAWSDIRHVRVTSVEDMLSHVEMLTIHVPLNASTRGMISLKQMKKMRKSAVLINVARGGIVNELDLANALRNGLLFGAGLDCHEEEPPTLKRYSDLWETGRVISTPHIGATTADTQVETATAAINRVHKYLMDRGSW
jgi:phosphoglycerate dehydrogenase-like enzyme